MGEDSKILLADNLEIPEKVRVILSTDETRDKVIAIADEVKLEKATDVAKFSRSILLLFLKRISLDNYPYVLQNELGVDEKTALKMATYVGKVFLVPHQEDYFPEAEEYFQKWLAQAKSMGVDFTRRQQPAKEQPEAKPAPEPEPKSEPQAELVPESEPKSEPAKVQSAATAAGVVAAAKPQVSPPKDTTPPPVSDIKPAERKGPAPVPRSAAPEPAKSPATLQLTTTADLENISPRVLDVEPPDAGKLTDRLKEEIQDIANKSGASRSDIVAAWKKSQLYHAYIDMGNDSMQQGKSITETAAFRKAAGKPYLSEPQFNAISEVSRLLLS